MKRLANNITHKTFNEINLEDSFLILYEKIIWDLMSGLKERSGCICTISRWKNRGFFIFKDRGKFG